MEFWASSSLSDSGATMALAEADSISGNDYAVLKWDPDQNRFTLMGVEAMRISTNPAGDLAWLAQQDNTLQKGTFETSAKEQDLQAISTT